MMKLVKILAAIMMVIVAMGLIGLVFKTSACRSGLALIIGITVAVGFMAISGVKLLIETVRS